jgi:hypothetical protein
VYLARDPEEIDLVVRELTPEERISIMVFAIG